jgi:hypothetical protein
MRGKSKFEYDPENGGGRARRIKNVSRLELLKIKPEQYT